jgi:general secretion pathway protein K
MIRSTSYSKAPTMIRSMPDRNRGFALILVIWSLVILLGLSAGFAMAVRYETRVANDVLAATETLAIATAARNLALVALNHREVDERWQPDGRVRGLSWADARIAVRVRSDSGRVDLNRAPRAVLVGLFEQIAPEREPERLADTLIDWRDRDDRRSELGAEADDYRDAGLEFGPSNQPLHSVHELSQVLGFDGNLARALMPFVTVHSRRPRVNALSAEPTVLAALPDIDGAIAEQFVEARELALDSGMPPPIEMLRDARRYVEMQMDARVLLMDIAIARPERPLHIEQVVLALDGLQTYALLSRETLTVSANDPWWQR